MGTLKLIGSFLMGGTILAGLIFLSLFFVKGGVWLSLKVLPWLFIIIWPVLAVDILIIIPLGIFKKTKGIASFGLSVSSYVSGLTLWLWALILTYSLWGALAVYIGLFIVGVGVIPLSILATAFEGQWSILGQLIFLLFLTLGSIMLGKHFAVRADELANERYQRTLRKRIDDISSEKEEEKVL